MNRFPCVPRDFWISNFNNNKSAFERGIPCLPGIVMCIELPSAPLKLLGFLHLLDCVSIGMYIILCMFLLLNYTYMLNISVVLQSLCHKSALYTISLSSRSHMLIFMLVTKHRRNLFDECRIMYVSVFKICSSWFPF